MRPFTVLISILVLLYLLPVHGQQTSRLPRSTPEQEGVSSSGIVAFLNAIDPDSLEIHSFMFVRHGKVIAEGWWKPYGPEYRHLLFSASKTFTATAVGLAVSENRLKVSDKVVSFFPYSLPDSISDSMKEMTVEDLLTMSTGQDPEPNAWGIKGDWMMAFLDTRPVHRPGTVFKYNNMATFMLSAIVQQVTGEPIFNYLMPRIFIPLGIRGIDWDLNPQGINLGMIGLRLRTEDLAAFGLLWQNDGMWNTKQLLPKEWIREAASFHIKNADESDKNSKSNDWAQGYAYQMWRGKNNTFRVDGMGGQFVVFIPGKDAFVVCTANVRNTQKQLDLIYNHLIPAIKSDSALPPEPKLQSEIRKKTTALCIKPGFAVSSNSNFEAGISNKEFIIAGNEYTIQSVYFTFGNDECTFTLKRENALSSIRAGLKEWKISGTSSSSLLAPPRTVFSKSADAQYTIVQPVIRLGAMYSWTNENTLEITGRFIEESLGAETIVCRFSKQKGDVYVSIEQKTPASPSRPIPERRQSVVLRGSMVNIE